MNTKSVRGATMTSDTQFRPIRTREIQTLHAEISTNSKYHFFQFCIDIISLDRGIFWM